MEIGHVVGDRVVVGADGRAGAAVVMVVVVVVVVVDMSFGDAGIRCRR